MWGTINGTLSIMTEYNAHINFLLKVELTSILYCLKKVKMFQILRDEKEEKKEVRIS